MLLNTCQIDLTYPTLSSPQEYVWRWGKVLAESQLDHIPLYFMPFGIIQNSRELLEWNVAQHTAALSLLHLFLWGLIAPVAVPKDLYKGKGLNFPPTCSAAELSFPGTLGVFSPTTAPPCNFSSILLYQIFLFYFSQKPLKTPQTPKSNRDQ